MDGKPSFGTFTRGKAGFEQKIIKKILQNAREGESLNQFVNAAQDFVTFASAFHHRRRKNSCRCFMNLRRAKEVFIFSNFEIGHCASLISWCCIFIQFYWGQKYFWAKTISILQSKKQFACSRFRLSLALFRLRVIEFPTKIGLGVAAALLLGAAPGSPKSAISRDQRRAMITVSRSQKSIE